MSFYFAQPTGFSRNRKCQHKSLSQYILSNISFGDAASHKLHSKPWDYDVQKLAPDLRGFAPPLTGVTRHINHREPLTVLNQAQYNRKLFSMQSMYD
jgi:hypothetical protein